jgi:hypothetical protein
MNRIRNNGGGAAAFPTLMNDDEIDQASIARRRDPHDPFRREEKPNPWPIIEQRYPRIAATIRDLWGKRALDVYFNQLVVDERGGREGFHPDVLAAILEVARLHSQRFSLDTAVSPWEADMSETKWWTKR